MIDEVDLDGEVVLFDGHSVHHLAGPAAAVWLLADGDLDARGLAGVLVEAFGVDVGAARTAVDNVLVQLRGLGLLEP